MVAFLYGELKESERESLKSHIKWCKNCRMEFEQLKKIHKAAHALNQDIDEALASIDWQNLPAKIVDTVFEKKLSSVHKQKRIGFWRFLFLPRFRPAFAGVLLGVLLGSLITFLIFKSRPPQISENGRVIIPQGFYEKMELEMARRETIDYLEKSEYLLLDFVQSSPEKFVGSWQSEFASQKTRNLLSKKKYIDPQLDKLKLAKAKLICDQIELLFFELMQISERLSAEELKKIQTLIQERQLLLKIKLVKKELEKSEV